MISLPLVSILDRRRYYHLFRSDRIWFVVASVGRPSNSLIAHWHGTLINVTIRIATIRIMLLIVCGRSLSIVRQCLVDSVRLFRNCSCGSSWRSSHLCCFINRFSGTSSNGEPLLFYFRKLNVVIRGGGHDQSRFWMILPQTG